MFSADIQPKNAIHYKTYLHADFSEDSQERSHF